MDNSWLRRIVLSGFAVVLATMAVISVRARVGHWLVREDGTPASDVVAVSIGGWYAGAIEAAALVRAGVSERVVVSRWAEPDPATNDRLRGLGIDPGDPVSMVRRVFARSGVSDAAVEVLDVIVDGTGPDVARLAAAVRARGARRVLLITSRSHGRRAGWLMERALGGRITVAVHCPPNDPFDPAAWWESRSGVREVLTEGLRWVNALVLADAWAE